MAVALVAPVCAGGVRFRRSPRPAHRVTPGARQVPGRDPPNVARLVWTPVPGVGLGRSRVHVARDAPREADAPRAVRAEASAAPARSPSWDEADEREDVDGGRLPGTTSDEYVRKARSGVAGLQPSSTVCEDMYCTDPG